MDDIITIETEEGGKCHRQYVVTRLWPNRIKPAFGWKYMQFKAGRLRNYWRWTFQETLERIVIDRKYWGCFSKFLLKVLVDFDRS